MGFLDRLRELAHQRPGHSAICDAQGEWGYAALAERVQAACGSLHGQGIDADATVGITLADETEHLVATLALLACGARQIVLATHDPASMRQQLAARVGLTHLLAGDGVPALEGVARVAWPCEARPATHATAAPAGGGRLVLRTSGTTGGVNLVAFDEAQIAAQAARHDDYRDERLLRLASIEHNNSKRHRLYCVWAGAATSSARRMPSWWRLRWRTG